MATFKAYIDAFPDQLIDNAEKNGRHLQNGISRRDFVKFEGRKVYEFSDGVYIDDLTDEQVSRLEKQGVKFHKV